MKTDVLIAGAGPVGLSLALELANHGVRSVVIERKYQNAPTTVRCNHVSSRSMEFFRKNGFADAVRSAGLPPTMRKIALTAHRLRARNSRASRSLPVATVLQPRILASMPTGPRPNHRSV